MAIVYIKNFVVLSILIQLHLQIVIANPEKSDTLDGNNNNDNINNQKGIKPEVPQIVARDFNTITFIEQSFNPLIIKQAMPAYNLETIKPWLFLGAQTRDPVTVTTFCRIHCCDSGANSASDSEGHNYGDKHDTEDDTNSNNQINQAVNVDGKIHKQTIKNNNLNHDIKMDDKIQKQKDTNNHISLDIKMDGNIHKQHLITADRRACVLSMWKHLRHSRDINHVSLWWFLSAPDSYNSCLAWTSVTRDLGRFLTVPSFMEDFDLSVLDWQQTGLLHLYAGSTSDNTVTASGVVTITTSGITSPARVVCIFEGGGFFATLQERDGLEQWVGAYSNRDCLYLPSGWAVQLTAELDTTALFFTWQDDLILNENFFARLLKSKERDNQRNAVPIASRGPRVEESSPETLLKYEENQREEAKEKEAREEGAKEGEGREETERSEESVKESRRKEERKGKEIEGTKNGEESVEVARQEEKREKDRESNPDKNGRKKREEKGLNQSEEEEESQPSALHYLISFMPAAPHNSSPKQRIAWIKEPILPHILRHYYFNNKQSMSKEEFLDKAKMDAELVPHMVDCLAGSACHHLLLDLFTLLDLDSNGAIQPEDLASLKPWLGEGATKAEIQGKGSESQKNKQRIRQRGMGTPGTNARVKKSGDKPPEDGQEIEEESRGTSGFPVLEEHGLQSVLETQLDDLVQELRDVTADDWEDATQGNKKDLSAFMRRAEERMHETARLTASRIRAGDLSATEERTIQDNLPGLHEQLLRHRAAKSNEGSRDEL